MEPDRVQRSVVLEVDGNFLGVLLMTAWTEFRRLHPLSGLF
jgi:hypothetical protein